jgi:hypothetical protein
MANILVVLTSTTAPTADEQAFEAILTGAGHTLTRHTYTADAPSDAAYDLAISVLGTGIQSDAKMQTFASWTKGVMVAHDTMPINIGLASTNSHGSSNAAQLEVKDGTTYPELVAGKTSPVTALAAADSWRTILVSNLAAGAVRVWGHNGNGDSSVVAVIPAGGTLVGGGAAPGRRAMFIVSIVWLPWQSLTTDAKDIFLATVAWVAGGTAPDPGPRKMAGVGFGTFDTTFPT